MSTQQNKTLIAVVIGLTVGGLTVALLGCGSRSSAQTDAASLQTGGQCQHPTSLDDAGAGACAIGKFQLDCRFPSGAGCLCVTNASSCEGCGPESGATCTSKCKDNEYGVSCGGPPSLDASFAYADPPANCRSIGVTPGGSTSYCCSCL